MAYRLAADAVLLLHLSFILFAIFGSLLALRWLWVAWLHVPITSWGVWVSMAGRTCPLTPLENDFRHAAGGAGYEGGFIEHYLLAFIYPDGLTRPVEFWLGVTLLAANIIVYGFIALRGWRRRRVQGAA